MLGVKNLNQMGKQAVIKWNAEQLVSIKRDLLLFDTFYYDPYLLTLQIDLLKNVSNLVKNDSSITDEIQTSVDYFSSKGLLKEFSLQEFKEGKIKLLKIDNEGLEKIIKAVKAYDIVHKTFLDNYNRAVDLLQKDYRSGFLKYISLLNDFRVFADYHVRLTSILVEKSRSGMSITPIIECTDKIEGGKETEVLHLVIKNLPIPDELIPYDEIIDFKSQNERKYYGLIQWINKVSKSEFDINEIEDELKFYTLEFEETLKLERAKYRLTNLEIILSLPLEIVENLVKLKWSQIPKTLISIKKSKIDLMLAESKLPGKEMAYISAAKKKFQK